MLIGLSGYARAGKDSVAAVLVEEFGFIRKAFADTMRSMALAIDPVIVNSYPDGSIKRLSSLVSSHGWEYAKRSEEVRRFLQYLGTEGVRKHLGEDTWVNALMSTIVDGDNVAIADCRFPNEARAIANVGGEVWRIQRPGNDPANAHASETALDAWGFDHVLHNNGSLEKLREQVVTTMRSVRC